MEKRDDDAEKVVESVVLTKRGLRERSIVNKILLNAKLSLIHVNLYGGSLMDFEVIIQVFFCEETLPLAPATPHLFSLLSLLPSPLSPFTFEIFSRTYPNACQ